MSILHFHFLPTCNIPFASLLNLNYDNETLSDLTDVFEFNTSTTLSPGDNVIVAFNKSLKSVVAADKYSDETDSLFHEKFDKIRDVFCYTLNIEEKSVFGVQ